MSDVVDAEPVAQLEDQPFGAFLPDARDLGQSGNITAGHGPADRGRAMDGQNGLREPRPDTAGGLQQFEDLRSSSSTNPYRVNESSRTTREVASLASCRSCSLESVFGVH